MGNAAKHVLQDFSMSAAMEHTCRWAGAFLAPLKGSGWRFSIDHRLGAANKYLPVHEHGISRSGLNVHQCTLVFGFGHVPSTILLCSYWTWAFLDSLSLAASEVYMFMRHDIPCDAWQDVKVIQATTNQTHKLIESLMVWQ